jgi:putative NIF3 family GTP cyclohydrolase 1 type 2
MHTNLDNSFHGVNHQLAKVIGLRDIRILQPEGNDPMTGAGMIGTLENGMSERDFLSHLCEKLDTPCLRHNKTRGKDIKTVAICGGSGAFLVGQAVREGADAYVTADIKYHEFADADNIFLVDAGHFETEQFAKHLLKEIIIKKIPNFAAQISEKSQNPVSYFVK